MIVTDNMFGDIITDLGAMIQGGMGIAAGGNINPDGVSMFEPIGGTAPTDTGKGTINPLAAIGAMEMLLRAARRGAGRGAASTPGSGSRCHEAATSMRAGEMGFSTPEVGDLVVEGRGMSGADPAVAPASSSTTPRCATARSAPGLSLLVEDRLRILHKLDQLGLPVHRGRLAGREPARHRVLPARAPKETLEHAELVAFGMTRRAGEQAEDAPTLRDLLDAGTEVVCLVGKAGTSTSPRRCGPTSTRAWRWSRDSVAFLPAQGRRVFFDAEHFFDGYRGEPEFALRVLEAAAEEAGAERLVLCDTNGGTLPHDVARDRGRGPRAGRRRAARDPLPQRRRAARSPTRCRGVAAGAPGPGHVNGYGERTGNANLSRSSRTSAEDGRTCLPEGAVERLTERRALRRRARQLAPGPAAAVRGPLRVHPQGGPAHERRRPRVRDAYEHVDPDAVGNGAASSRPTSAAARRSG